MNYTNDSPLNIILNSLFKSYQENVTDLNKISSALVEKGVIRTQSEIVNDHIAFRTLGVEHLGIQSFEKIFLKHGYTKKDRYHFETKKLKIISSLPKTFFEFF